MYRVFRAIFEKSLPILSRNILKSVDVFIILLANKSNS